METKSRFCDNKNRHCNDVYQNEVLRLFKANINNITWDDLKKNGEEKRASCIDSFRMMKSAIWAIESGRVIERVDQDLILWKQLYREKNVYLDSKGIKPTAQNKFQLPKAAAARVLNADDFERLLKEVEDNE